MSRTDPQSRSESSQDKSTRQYGFYLLLGFCVIAGLSILVYELTADRKIAPENAAAAKPHGPGDFRSVFMFNALKGLEKGGNDVYAKQPPISEGYWPCSHCHNPKKDNLTQRILVKDHQKIELHHGANRWCFDCHDRQNRDRLHLTSGELVPFEESSRLCGQCHGHVYEDWQAGAHGQRIGYWDGPRRNLVCINCHWPHSPRFQSIEPLPPPVRPEFAGLGLLRSAAETAAAKTAEDTKKGATE